MQLPETTEQFLSAVAAGRHRRGAGSKLRKLIASRERQLFGQVACYCCADPISVSSATIEHIVPVSLGGKMLLDNLALSHAACNQARGSQQTQRASITRA